MRTIINRVENKSEQVSSLSRSSIYVVYTWTVLPFPYIVQDTSQQVLTVVTEVLAVQR